MSFIKTQNFFSLQTYDTLRDNTPLHMHTQH